MSEAPTDDEYQSAINARKSAVQSKVNMGNHAAALETCLEDPPTRTKTQSLKDENLEIVMSVLTGLTKDADIKAAVAKLDATQLNTLLKYVYRGLESGEGSSALLKWHDQVFQLGSYGAISRVLADKQTV